MLMEVIRQPEQTEVGPHRLFNPALAQVPVAGGNQKLVGIAHLLVWHGIVGVGVGVDRPSALLHPTDLPQFGDDGGMGIEPRGDVGLIFTLSRFL